MFLYPVTVTEREFDPPDPVQVSEKLLAPDESIVISADPDVPLEPDQDPDAEHEVALDELQERVTEFPSNTSAAEALKVIDGAGFGGGVSPPPPPPPPQEAMNIRNIKYL